MNREVIQSVGIDIGTSTTQLVFSKFVVENLAAAMLFPGCPLWRRKSLIEARSTSRL